MKKFLFLMVLVLGMMSCTLVDNSEVGIKFNKFSITDQGKLEAVNVTGFVAYNPFTTAVYTYPVFVQQVNYDPFVVTTKDAASFKMDPYLSYQIDRNKATDIFSKYRKPLNEIEKGYLKTCIYDSYRVSANNYTSDELMANRAQFEAEVRKMLETSLGTEGFIIHEFTSQIEPPQSLKQAIDDKNAALQESLRAENLVKQAQAQAQIEIAKAEGEAKALRIKAESEAYANKVVSQSLTTLLIQQQTINKWNGQLPTVSGSNTMPIINLK